MRLRKGPALLLTAHCFDCGPHPDHRRCGWLILFNERRENMVSRKVEIERVGVTFSKPFEVAVEHSFGEGAMRAKIILSLWTLVLLSGCAGIGPPTVSRDRFDYTAAISDSSKRQMLVNLVKIRYGDEPIFMDVASVISQYQVTGQVNLGATITPQSATRSDTVGATGQYVDRPTITFTPMQGDKFARSLMSPIAPHAILNILQAGYSVDLVFRALVQEINGIRNRSGIEPTTHAADADFYALLEKMRRIQACGGIGMRTEEVDRRHEDVLVFKETRNPATEEVAGEVKKMLGLDPLVSEFHVVFGTIRRNDKEVVLLTRSFLEILLDLSADIDVPAADVREERASPTFAETTVAGQKVPPLIRIRSSSEKPADAFVSVPYRNSYFWIDDRDLRSKTTFSFLLFVFSLVRGSETGAAPIVTIPTS
jgi:hypothetical protein